MEELIRTGKRAASVLTHARILLKAESAQAGPAGRRGDCRGRGVRRLDGVPGAPGVRGAGLTAALFRKQPTGGNIASSMGPRGAIGGAGLR